MSDKVEFIAQSGKTFSVQRYNKTTGATVGSAATGVVDSSVPTRYRVDFGTTLGGVVYVIATATNLRVTGYADLDHPGSQGYSSLGSLAEAEAQDINAIAEDLAEINTKIAAGTINVVSPVNADGSLNPIVIGDEYLAENARAIDVFIDPVAGISVETTSCVFGGAAKNRGSWLVTGTVAAVTVDGLPKWRMRSELESADTIECREGCYEWGATLLSAAGKRITKVTGEVQLIASQTVE